MYLVFRYILPSNFLSGFINSPDIYFSRYISVCFSWSHLFLLQCRRLSSFLCDLIPSVSSSSSWAPPIFLNGVEVTRIRRQVECLIFVCLLKMSLPYVSYVYLGCPWQQLHIVHVSHRLVVLWSVRSDQYCCVPWICSLMPFTSSIVAMIVTLLPLLYYIRNDIVRSNHNLDGVYHKMKYDSSI